MKNPAEFILACAKSRIDPVAGERVVELAHNIDWDAAIKLADEHGVVPLLFGSVQKFCPAAMPQAIREQLQTRVQGNTTQNLLLMRELINLIKAMDAEGIRVLPYKGPLLAMFGYGDLSLRQPGDLDILVPQRDVARSRELLTESGYRPETPMDAASEAAHIASPHEYHFTYIKSKPGVMVELHWQVVGKLFSFTADPDDLWEHGIQKKVAGTDIRLMCDEDLLIVLCAHGMKHFWTRLGWICDLAEFIRTHPQIDWTKLLKRATQLNARGITLVGLLLAHRVLGAAVHSGVLSVASSSLHKQAAQLDEHLFGDAEKKDVVPKGLRMQLTGGGVFQSLRLHMASREDWFSGIRYCLHRLFTPTVLDREHMKLPRGLGFLYYFIRPLRLVTKYALKPLSRSSDSSAAPAEVH